MQREVYMGRSAVSSVFAQGTRAAGSGGPRACRSSHYRCPAIASRARPKVRRRPVEREETPAAWLGRIAEVSPCVAGAPGRWTNRLSTRPGSFLWFYGTATNDPEHAHRLAACWNAFLQAETTEIERIDDGLWDMNDVLLAGAGWHVLQPEQASP